VVGLILDTLRSVSGCGGCFFSMKELKMRAVNCRFSAGKEERRRKVSPTSRTQDITHRHPQHNLSRVFYRVYLLLLHYTTHIGNVVTSDHLLPNNLLCKQLYVTNSFTTKCNSDKDAKIVSPEALFLACLRTRR